MKAPQIFGKQTLLKAVMVGIAVSCLGAAVVAAPLSVMSKTKVSAQAKATVARTSVEKASFAPLGQGPALQLGRAAGGAEEDCVKVTRVTGPDGSIYATRGLICAD